MSKIIGIDLGTTNSCVAVMEGGKPTVIASAEGGRTVPSIVAFSKDGERLVGQVAKRQAVTNPEKTIYSIKRFMGRMHNEVGQEEKLVPYKVVDGQNGTAAVSIDSKSYTPPEISAMILQKLKADAERYLGQKVEKAVITVPAYFNDAQRQATKDAGQIAGLDVVRIVNEPTAAALAYGMDKEGKAHEKIAVFDLGGGTFDISILEIGDGVFEVKSTNGDTHLGGDNIDSDIIAWLVDNFKKENGIDLSKDRMALQRLKEAAEKAKCELSSTADTEINLPFITAGADGPKHLVVKLSRAKLEEIAHDTLQKMYAPCENALKDSGVSKSEISQVILVGGSTRMPKVKQIAQEIFGKVPHEGVNPDEVVAVGAAIQAGVLGGDVKDVVLLDVTPLSLGLETLGGVMTKLIERNTTIPTSKSQVFSTAADGQTSVEIHVLQGDRAMASDNRTLGRFHLTDIPSAPRGIPQIEVTFDIDANGIVNVSAKDKGTGKSQKITITASSGLNKEEVEKMQKDAEAHAADDKAKRESAEVRNEADSLVYQAEKMLKESGDKADAALKSKIEASVKETKDSIAANDINKMKSAKEKLQQAVMELGSKAYAQQGGPAGAAPQGQPGPDAQAQGQSEPENKKDDGKTVDADFEEVK